MQEISQYVEDIKVMYHLRNDARKTQSKVENEQLDTILDVMEKVLVRLNEKL